MNNVKAQPTQVHFIPIYNSEAIQLHKPYYSHYDTFVVESLKFYISNLALYKDTQFVSFAEKQFFLYDLENPQPLSIGSNNGDVNTIRFNIGIDSITNTDGVMGNDLDPTNGMYWAWQSGYINIRIEGSFSNSSIKNKKFQYHLGGYRSPYNSLQNVQLTTPSSDTCIIYIDVHQFIDTSIHLNYYDVMSPSATAVQLSELFKNCFSTKR